MSAMRAMVTGGAGFIGSALVLALMRRENTAVTVFDKLTYAGRRENLASVADRPGFQFVRGDILDARHVRASIAEFRPTVIFHLAAESHVDRSIEDAGNFVRTNVEGTTVMLAAADDYCRSLSEPERSEFRFVHVSTDEVFGALGAEGRFNEDSPYRPNSPYAASKAASDMIAFAYHRTHGLPVVITNCSNNFGPRQYPEKLIPLLLVRARNEHSLPVYGQGLQVRDWLYVEDHVEALIAVAEGAVPGARYCIGGATELPNIETVRRVCRILDGLRPRRGGARYEELIEFVPDRPGHDFRYAIDHSRIARELGWRPRRAFDAALAETVRWYLDNGDWIAPLLDGSGNADVTRRRGLRVAEL